MERVNSILENKIYQKYLKRNEKEEKKRIFCRHDMTHFLDVARIALILNMEEDYGIDKELIYAVALLHDIGRWMQYEEGIPHEQASAKLAPEILIKSGFDEKEQKAVLGAILSHRDASVKDEKTLRGLLYRADKLSRACFACKAQEKCDWKAEKKNMRIFL